PRKLSAQGLQPTQEAAALLIDERLERHPRPVILNLQRGLLLVRDMTIPMAPSAIAMDTELLADRTFGGTLGKGHLNLDTLVVRADLAPGHSSARRRLRHSNFTPKNTRAFPAHITLPK